MDEIKVVVTGYGIATSVAVGEMDFKKALWEQRWNRLVTPDEITATAEGLFSAEICRRMDMHTKYGIIAAKLALEHSGVVLERMDSSRVGGILATIWGPIITTYDYFKEVIAKGPSHASPFLFPYTVTNAVTGAMARLLGLRGVSSMLVGCCPIHYAYHLIADGKADVVLAGGIDNATSFFEMTGNQPEKWSNLFDGACVIVLENEKTALQRDAKILAEIKGCASGNIQLGSEKEGEDYPANRLFQIMNQFLEDKRIRVDEIGGVISMLDGCSFYHELEQVEADAVSQLCKARETYLSLTRPYQKLGNLWAPQTTLNLCAALFSFAAGAFPWEKTSERLFTKSSQGKMQFLSNSFLYGGGFHSLLVSEY